MQVDLSDLKETLVSISNRIVTKIDFSLLYPDDLSESVQDSLWQQDISLDDIDYMLITFNIDLFVNIDETPNPEGKTQMVLPEDYNIERLINRSNDPKWYRAKINDKECVLGIAYH